MPQWVILKPILERRCNGQNRSVTDFVECLWLLHKSHFIFSNPLLFHRFTSSSWKLKPTSGLKTKLVWKSIFWLAPSSLQSGVRFFSYISICCCFWVIFHDTFSLTVKEAESDEWVDPFIIPEKNPIALIKIYYGRFNLPSKFL